MEASANLADASMLMRKIGFIVVLLRGLLLLRVFFPVWERIGAQAASAWAAPIRFPVKKSVMLPSTIAVTSGWSE